MAISDLINDLQALNGPDRKIDVSIALATGYRRKVDESNGERVVTWHHKSNPRAPVPRIPKFTEQIGAAYDLAIKTCPGREVGVSWGPEGGHATINGAGHCEGATSAIALCIAVLKVVDKQDR